ncbi:remorin [Dendrobium catenatum]|uniref:Remorin n=1 Tax=Dendrobium catenatum TaxID=906689 RepID=A0A2I0WYW0_9ASPA|nr:remorin [Dendrobium catenatum]PKU80827.1 Remorin [Dendrobium catenatum]
MGEEEAKNVEIRGSTEEATAPLPVDPLVSAPSESPKEEAEEKSMLPSSPEKKPEEVNALAIVEKVIDLPSTGKSSGGSGSADRDAVLARVENEKKMSLVKAWEDSEKVKAENKAIKKMADILAWENSKKAAVEAELRKIEEALEKKKAEYAEKMKNKIATIHKEAEEKRAIGEARRSQDILKVEEMAAKYRATGHSPKKQLGCF